mgnify:FL=1
MITHLPASIRVGPARYTLERNIEPDSAGRIAETIHYQRIIRISTGCPPNVLATTALHELLHAIWEHYGLTGFSDAAGAERVVDALASGLAQVLQDLGVWPEELRLAGET